MLIEKYTTDWIKNFEDLKREIENGLVGIKYQIEHVGSTSVPKLAAKPIIDIDIIYESQAEFKKIKSGLLRMGYFHNGNQGIEMREVFKRKVIQTKGILDLIKHHLYVCQINSKGLERHILLRDHLRKNDSARLEYESMKYRLAEKANQNQKVYAQLKELNVNDFIDCIIELEKLNPRAEK